MESFKTCEQYVLSELQIAQLELYASQELLRHIDECIEQEDSSCMNKINTIRELLKKDKDRNKKRI